MNTKPKRRWYQFTLRTFFVLVTLVCVGFGYWVHWSKEWIRQRHEATEGQPLVMMILDIRLTDLQGPRKPPIAPAGLWLFGEKGVWAIECHSRHIKLARDLFPEAWIIPESPPPSDPFVPTAP